MGSRVTLAQLKYFLAIVRAGSLSGAARDVFIAQPALSHQLQLLEQELGQQLFVRYARGVRLTDSGRRFQERAIAVLRQVESIKAELAAPVGEVIGEVVVGMAIAANMGFSVACYEEVGRRHPGVRLRLVESMSGFLPEWMQRGSIDLALTYDSPPSDHYQVDILGQESLYLVAPPELAQRLGPKVRLAQLADIPLVIPGFPHALRLLIDRVMSAHGIAPRVIAEVDSTYSIKKIIKLVDAAGILSIHGFREEVETGALCAVEIVEPEIRRSLCLLVGNGRQSDPAVAAVRAVIAEVVGERSGN